MDFKEKILILDFGSQYTQLIARRIRENKVYSEILPYNAPIKKIKEFDPKGIILSGGPSRVSQKNAPFPDKRIFDLGLPILGICYGMQLLAHCLGGRVGRSVKREYGRAELNVDDDKDLLKGIVRKRSAKAKNTPPAPPLTKGGMGGVVWMSHGDKIQKHPKGFKSIAHTDNSHVAAMADRKRKFYALQFHPEVVHTENGTKILKNFIFNICKCKPTWTMKSFIETEKMAIKEKVGKDKVVCAISGGVDSSVTAVLMHKAIGKQLTCIFVDNGVLRKDEAAQVNKMLKKNFKMNIIFVDAAERFLNKLKGVADPEKKRKIIGNEFIHIFNEEAAKIKDAKYLAQGTLYPDVIESTSFKGPSAIIKSHHNVGGLLKKMKLKLIEPMRELFKDEVRVLGREMGMSDEVINRHPFPGPGLAIRIIDKVTKQRADILRKADAIVIEEIRKAGLYDEIWQAFAVLLPIKTVGVMGDERTYENVLAVRAVTSVDGMTADWAKIPYDVLGNISNRIINEVKGVNRVVYDISSKPPGTIEWE
ncbi:GMP synthase [glutamine-hydrolyzing] [bacterium BMS3Bbin09]|nr:GMP synthase [glutamine-hydrolyzing] [bacterium BMS3Bbin09]HDH34664.1 glutamine-hydrolyzing GMP synthase [Nitrospirota bacterium]